MAECQMATSEVLDKFGLDRKTVLHSMNLTMESKLWISANKEKLRKKYANLFIAVKGSKLLESNKDVEKLVVLLKKKFKGQISDIVIEYIPEEDLLFIL